jgi:hypothetical protein
VSASVGILALVAECGEPEIAWQIGSGDERLTGWQYPDGTRAIETNSNPLHDDGDQFAEAWEQRTLSPA